MIGFSPFWNGSNCKESNPKVVADYSLKEETAGKTENLKIMHFAGCLGGLVVS